jgi:pyrroloquinoline quinone (PQQ) biosynthesis protein C
MLLPALLAAGPRLIQHPRVADLYVDFLLASHCIIRASVPLMEAARAQAEALQDDDAVAAALARYLQDHVPEETGHDDWLLDDLEVLGVERTTVLARPPGSAVAALVGAQYYWMFHYHPVALLGYIAVLEGYPPSMQLIQDLESRTAHDTRAFRTLRKHSELDPGHREELDELLDRLPLTRAQSRVIGLSAIHTVGQLTRVYEEIVP